MNLHLLQHKRLRSLLRRSEIRKGVVSFPSDPAPDNRVTVLKYAYRLSEFFKSAIEQLHQLLRGEVLRNVANVELPFRLVVIGEVRLRLLVAI